MWTRQVPVYHNLKLMCAAGTCHIIVDLLAQFGRPSSPSALHVYTSANWMRSMEWLPHYSLYLMCRTHQSLASAVLTGTNTAKVEDRENTSNYHKPVSGTSKNQSLEYMSTMSSCTWTLQNVTRSIMIRTQSMLVVQQCTLYTYM